MCVGLETDTTRGVEDNEVHQALEVDSDDAEQDNRHRDPEYDENDREGLSSLGYRRQHPPTNCGRGARHEDDSVPEVPIRLDRATAHTVVPQHGEVGVVHGHRLVAPGLVPREELAAELVVEGQLLGVVAVLLVDLVRLFDEDVQPRPDEKK